MKFELLLSTSIPAGLSLLGALLWTCHVRWAWTLLGGLLVEHWIALSNRPLSVEMPIFGGIHVCKDVAS